MKTVAISGAVIAALAVGALATPTSAQSYRGDSYGNGCRTRSDGTTGAVIGGIAGALLGSNLASHHGGRAGGAALGGVAGAVLGNSIARNNDGCRTFSHAYREQVYQAPVYGYNSGYSSGYNPRYSSGYTRGYGDNPGYGYNSGYSDRYAYRDSGRYEQHDDYRYRHDDHDEDRQGW